MIDTQGRAIEMQIDEDYILIYIGTAETDSGSILKSLQENIAEHLGI